MKFTSIPRLSAFASVSHAMSDAETGESIRIADDASVWQRLYDAANRLVAIIGYDGWVDAEHAAVSDLLAALNDMDVVDGAK